MEETKIAAKMKKKLITKMSCSENRGWRNEPAFFTLKSSGAHLDTN